MKKKQKKKKNHMEINVLKNIYMGIDIWENMLKKSNNNSLYAVPKKLSKKQEVTSLENVIDT